MGRAFVDRKESFCSSGDMAWELDGRIKAVNVQKAPALWSALYGPPKL